MELNEEEENRLVKIGPVNDPPKVDEGELEKFPQVVKVNPKTGRKVRSDKGTKRKPSEKHREGLKISRAKAMVGKRVKKHLPMIEQQLKQGYSLKEIHEMNQGNIDLVHPGYTLRDVEKDKPTGQPKAKPTGQPKEQVKEQAKEQVKEPGQVQAHRAATVKYEDLGTMDEVQPRQKPAYMKTLKRYAYI